MSRSRAPKTPFPMYPSRRAFTITPEHLNLHPVRAKSVPTFCPKYRLSKILDHQAATSGSTALDAAGVSKGGAFARSAPLADFFGYFLVRRQESNITALLPLQKGIPFCNLHKYALFLFLSERADIFFFLCYTEENIGRRHPYEYCRRKNPPGWHCCI